MNIVADALAQGTEKVAAATEKAAAAARGTNTVSVDFSQLDLVAGVAVGVILALGLVLVVLWALVKAGVIRFGAPKEDQSSNHTMNEGATACSLAGAVSGKCVEHLAEKERSLGNRENIVKLWEKYDGVTEKLEKLLTTLLSNQNTLMLGMIQKGLLPPTIQAEMRKPES
jgi:hypothetical protein